MPELVHTRIDSERLTREATHPGCGAVALFLGTTRDHHQGRRVLRLTYEAYERMALAALERVERGACERYAITRCGIVHRLGEVPPGEASVAVVVTAEHRAPAFDACRWAMDELKRSVTIWKKELFEDGGEEWVRGTSLR